MLLIGTDQTSETLDEEAALCRSLAGIFSHTQALHLAIYKLDQGDSTAASYGEWREEEGGRRSVSRMPGDLRISELLSVVIIKDFEEFLTSSRCQAR